MGNSYVNVLMRGADHDAVADLLDVRALGIPPLGKAEVAEIGGRGSALHQRYRKRHLRAIEETIKLGPLDG